jgi:hypothetical protein
MAVRHVIGIVFASCHGIQDQVGKLTEARVFTMMLGVSQEKLVERLRLRGTYLEERSPSNGIPDFFRSR